MIYKVLTLWQPWATLFAYGIKQMETRPKSTSFGGTYLIHSAKQFNKSQKDKCEEKYFAEALHSLGIEDIKKLPVGAIIGAYDHIQCIKIPIFPEIISRTYSYPENSKMKDLDIIVPPNYPELAFGDYTPGRYVWTGDNHRVLKEPIPYKNGQGYYLPFKGDESKLIFK